MNLTPEQREIGRDNYYSAVTAHDQWTRRGFLGSVLATGAVAGVGGLYFGYGRPDRPIRIGIIGTGDEGNVLIGALNPDYVQVTRIADIRPSSIHRAFHGDWSSPNATAARPGLMNVYGWKSEDEAMKHVKYSADYKDVINDPEIEGVIIAVPLHLHAPMAIEAMKNGKHVLVEKLMAHSVAECKWMGRVAEQQRLHLATGHQRHYSILYDNAVNLIRWGVLGQIHHIRAQWHRGNLPGKDSWAMPVPGGEHRLNSSLNGVVADKEDKILSQLRGFESQLASDNLDKKERDLIIKKRDQWSAWNEDQFVPAEQYGYVDDTSIYPGGKVRTALEELVRWRLWERTGGGLMAELGSHQLDASSIFISALAKEKVQPLNVHAVGGRHIFPLDRDADDHVYCMFEFPGPDYDPGFKVGYRDVVNRVGDIAGSRVHGYDPEQHANKKIVVTYSSINGNGYGGYGEIVMGTKGTLVLEKEKEVMLYQTSSTSAKVGVKKDGAGAPTLDTTASGDVGLAKAAEASGPVSRGYKEQIEHWAWCIRAGDWGNAQPRCTPKIALGDAVLALTAKLAIRNSNAGKGGYIDFDPNWFDIHHDAVPEDPQNRGEGPNIVSTARQLGIV